MLGLTGAEWAALFLHKIYLCVEAYFLMGCVYFKPKKNKLTSFLASFVFLPVCLFEGYFSIMLSRGVDVFLFHAIFVAIKAFWPAYYSKFFDRDRFESQFICYFTNSFNPFLYVAVMAVKFISDKYAIPNVSVTWVVLNCIFVLSGILLFVPIVKKFVIPRLHKIPRFLVKGLVIIVPVSQVFPLMTNYTNNEIFDSWMFYVIFIAFGITLCVVGYVIYRYAGERTEREKLELALKFEGDKKNYFDIIEQHSQKISKMSHDISNHLRTIQLLAQNSNNTELTEYSENLLSEYSNSLKAYCKNPTINAMLLYYDSFATKNGVLYKAQANIEKEIKISQVDLVSIISNVLDNAFEACEELKEREKIVDITIDTKNNAFVCVCKNTFDGKVTKKDRKFYTRKKEDNHGLGIGIIQETVKRLDGKCEFDYDEQNFLVTVYIPV